METLPSDEEIDRVLEEMCCKRCFGRGYVGWTLANDPVLCGCVVKREKVSHDARINTKKSVDGGLESVIFRRAPGSGRG